MRKRWLLIGIGLLVTMLALGAVACGDDDEGEEPAPTEVTAADPTDAPDEGGSAVKVSLLEWQVAPDVDSVSAGSITFNANNIGADTHELVIIRTDLAPDALPTGADGSVDESGEGIIVIDEIEEFDAGSSESLTIDLEAGSYVLICNVVEEEADGTIEAHYAEGMYIAFTITE